MKYKVRILFYGWIIILFLPSVYVTAQQSRLPEGNQGIAAQFQNDNGIQNHSAILFTENFEESTINEMLARWEEKQNVSDMSFSPDVPQTSGGKQSYLTTHTGGKGNGAHLYRRLLPGHKQVFARFYVKFDPNCAQIHHFGTHLGGFNPSTPWPQGGAGVLPEGDKRFTTGVEPFGNDWNWDFYSYWQGMRVHGDGNYWGTPFLAGAPKPKIIRGEWICVEMMVKMNDPVDESNGEQAFWINGELWRVDGQVVSHAGKGFPKGKWAGGWWQPDSKVDTAFEGFQWRTVEDLAVNYIWTYVYITKAPRGHISKVWFDDIVVATEYIGPLNSAQNNSTVEQWKKK